jgi:hypothetical protein
MTDDGKVIHIWDWYKPRKSDDSTTAIRRLLLRRKFRPGERVHYRGDQTDCGTVVEVSFGGDLVRVLWDRRKPREQWNEVLDVHRVQNS